MSDLIYARASDNVAALVTPTAFAGTTINAMYPLTRLIDKDPATAAKSTTTGDFRIVWDFTGTQRVDAVWVPIHNAPAGISMRFEGHASSSWASPTVSATYTVPAYGGDLPRGVYIDITAAGGYSATGLRFWSLFVPNVGIVTAIGEIFIGSVKRTTRNLLVGVTRTRDRRVTMHQRHDGGYFKYDRGSDVWAADGRVIPTTDAEFSDYLTLCEDARGVLYPFPIVLEAHTAVPEGHLVQWLGGFRQVNRSGRPGGPVDTIEELSFTWQMVPRGRAL